MNRLSGFHCLPLMSPGAQLGVAEPVNRAQLHDPAHVVFTDFNHAPCVTVDHSDSLDATLHTMASAHVHMAFVTDVRGRVIGYVSTQDLQGERPVLRAAADHLRLDELTLDHLMVPTQQWSVVEENFLAHARVGDVVATLQEASLRYLLVMAHRDGEQVLRGVFSARQIEAAVGLSVQDDLHLTRFSDLGVALTH